LSRAQANEAFNVTYETTICRNDIGTPSLCKINKKCFSDVKKRI